MNVKVIASGRGALVDLLAQMINLEFSVLSETLDVQEGDQQAAVAA